jgi:hypothetical protein
VSPASHCGDPGSRRGQFMSVSWWIKWHWYKFLSEFFGFPLSVSFHRRCPHSYIIWVSVSQTVVCGVSLGGPRRFLKKNHCKNGIRHLTKCKIGAHRQITSSLELVLWGWNTAEHRGRVVNTPASHSGSPRFKPRPGRLSWLRFFVFLSVPQRKWWDSTLN